MLIGGGLHGILFAEQNCAEPFPSRALHLRHRQCCYAPLLLLKIRQQVFGAGVLYTMKPALTQCNIIFWYNAPTLIGSHLNMCSSGVEQPEPQRWVPTLPRSSTLVIQSSWGAAVNLAGNALDIVKKFLGEDFWNLHG